MTHSDDPFGNLTPVQREAMYDPCLYMPGTKPLTDDQVAALPLNADDEQLDGEQ